MSSIRKKYDEEFKKNAVKLSYASAKTVKDIADDLGVRENLKYVKLGYEGLTIDYEELKRVSGID